MKKLLLLYIASLSFSGIAQEKQAAIGSVDTISMFNGAGFDIFYSKIITPRSISVSTTLNETSSKYDKRNLIDGDHKTAWVEGLKGDGAGTDILIEFDEEDLYPVIIEFLPGYAKNMKTWVSNNAVKSVEVFYLDETKNIDKPIIHQEIKFNNAPLKWQHYNFGGDILHNMGLLDFKYLQIRIKHIYKGTKFNDTCISELVFKTTGKKRAEVMGDRYKRID